MKLDKLWIAFVVYLLVAIVRKHLRFEARLHTILTIIEVNVFETIPVHQLITDTMRRIDLHENQHITDKQLNLFAE